MRSFTLTNPVMFVVPNRACVINDFGWDGYKEAVRELATANGWTVNDDTKLVCVWIASDETSNLYDHDARVEGLAEDEYLSISAEHIPVDVLRKVNEGDTLTVTIPAHVVSGGHPTEECVLKLDILVDTQSYKYRRFGTLQDVLNKIA